MARDGSRADPRAASRSAACIVGTAVYQVGVELVEPVEEPQLVEARGAGDGGAGVERGEQRGDEAVDVEERHHVEAAVRTARARASRRRSRADAHSWRCVSGTSFGREVVPDVCSTSATSSGSGRVVRAPRPTALRRGRRRRRGPDGSTCSSSTWMPRSAATSRAGVSSVAPTTTASRADVLEVEGELLRAVRGVERRRGRRLRDREKRACRLRAVLDQQGDAALGSQSALAKPAGGLRDELQQARVRERAAARRQQRRSLSLRLS